VADPVLATLGVVISTAVVGLTFFVVTPWLGLAVPLLYCLIFGALISPTDPVAVLAVIKRVGVPKSLETRVAGESISIALALSLLAFAGRDTVITTTYAVVIFSSLVQALTFERVAKHALRSAATSER